MKSVIVLIVGILWTAASAQAQPASNPIVIGTSHRLKSKALGQERTINVVLPAGYAEESSKRYPVLYLIDGGVEQDLLHVSGAVHLGALWGRSSEAIVVGVETKDRRKELAGPTRDPELLKKYPTAGSSETFRLFLRDNVMPLVQRTYRASGRNVVLGESLAGLFIVETYLSEPQMFAAYAAIDPSLWWDKESLSKAAEGKVGARQKGKPLYLAIAKEQADEPDAMNRLIGTLRKSGQEFCLSATPGLVHATIYQQLTPAALQFLLPPSEAPPPEFGFEVKCSLKS